MINDVSKSFSRDIFVVAIGTYLAGILPALGVAGADHTLRHVQISVL